MVFAGFAASSPATSANASPSFSHSTHRTLSRSKKYFSDFFVILRRRGKGGGGQPGKKRDSRGIAATKSGVLDGRVDVGRAFGRRAARTHLSSLLTVSCHVRISRVEPLPRDIFLVPVRVEVCAARESVPSETTHRED